MLGFKYIEEKDCFECEKCGAEVQRGIVNISGHWGKCAGKKQMDFVNKVDKSSLAVEDKMDLIRNEFLNH